MRADEVTTSRGRGLIALVVAGAIAVTLGIVFMAVGLLRVGSRHPYGALTQIGAILFVAGLAFGAVVLSLYAIGKGVAGRRSGRRASASRPEHNRYGPPPPLASDRPYDAGPPRDGRYTDRDPHGGYPEPPADHRPRQWEQGSAERLVSGDHAGPSARPHRPPQDYRTPREYPPPPAASGQQRYAPAHSRPSEQERPARSGGYGESGRPGEPGGYGAPSGYGASGEYDRSGRYPREPVRPGEFGAPDEHGPRHRDWAGYGPPDIHGERQPRPAAPPPHPSAPRPPDPRLSDVRSPDPRSTDPRLADPRSPDQRSADPRSADPRLADPRWFDSRSSDPSRSHPRSADPRPGDLPPGDLRFDADQRRLFEPRSPEHRRPESRPPEPPLAEPGLARSSPDDLRRTEPQLFDARTLDARLFDPRPPDPSPPRQHPSDQHPSDRDPHGRAPRPADWYLDERMLPAEPPGTFSGARPYADPGSGADPRFGHRLAEPIDPTGVYSPDKPAAAEPEARRPDRPADIPPPVAPSRESRQAPPGPGPGRGPGPFSGHGPGPGTGYVPGTGSGHGNGPAHGPDRDTGYLPDRESGHGQSSRSEAPSVFVYRDPGTAPVVPPPETVPAEEEVARPRGPFEPPPRHAARQPDITHQQYAARQPIPGEPGGDYGQDAGDFYDASYRQAAVPQRAVQPDDELSEPSTAHALDQIKDLYATAEAIGDANVDRHFDELLARQRELITEFFNQARSKPDDSAATTVSPE